MNNLIDDLEDLIASAMPLSWCHGHNIEYAHKWEIHAHRLLKRTTEEKIYYKPKRKQLPYSKRARMLLGGRCVQR